MEFKDYPAILLLVYEIYSFYHFHLVIYDPFSANLSVRDSLSPLRPFRRGHRWGNVSYPLRQSFTAAAEQNESWWPRSGWSRGAVGTISSRDESMEEGILRGAVMRERRTRAGDETIVLHPRRAKRKMYLAWQSSNKGRDARVNPCHPASLSFFPLPPSLSILRFRPLAWHYARQIVVLQLSKD